MPDLWCFKCMSSQSNGYQKLWIIVCVISLQLVLCTLVDAQCRDQSLCSFMASQGECENDPEYMLSDCPKSCKNPCLCPGVSQDTACDCLVKAKSGYCADPGALTDCHSTCTKVTHESCSLLPVPADPNARLSTWSTNYLTTVTEVCVPGYAPLDADNQGKKTCSSGQRWVDDPYNGNPVECTPIDCGPPPTAPNAFSVPTDTSFGSKADYTCARGYVHVQGQMTLTCNSNASWEGEIFVCKKVECGAPQPSANASFKVANSSSGQTVTYTCSMGFSRTQGDEILRCSSAGVWQGSLIVCTVIDCGSPPSPSNSQVIAMETTYGKTANFTCMDGYVRVEGQAVLTCNASGAWDPKALVCDKVNCGQPLSAPNTDVTVINTSYGDTANYTCTRGYAYDVGDMTLTCGLQGTWEGVLMSCIKVNCGQPPADPNTDVTVINTSYGDTANYTCTRGYAYDEGDMILTCGWQGTWEGVLMSCIKVNCGQPPSSPHTDVTVNNTSYGDTANYTCTRGYAYDEGDMILTCGSQGTWEGVLMSCIKVNCGQPPNSPHTDVAVNNTSYGDTANYTCTRGYAYDEGDMILTCGSQGTWEGVLMSCIKVNCGQPPSSPHTDVAVNNTSYGDTANYTCTRGYAYDEGDMILTCGSQGTWEGVLMSCIKVTCGQPPPALNTDVAVSNTSYGDTANYTCTRGYAYDEGDMILTCGSQGTWEGVLISCIRVDCGPPPASSSANLSVNGTRYGDTAGYVCAPGHKQLNGSSTLTCGATGNWEGVVITCQRVDCGPSPASSSANLSVNGTRYGDTAGYVCAPGHKQVNGSSTLTCGPTGNWEGVVITCQRVSCGQPPSSANTSVTTTGTQYGDSASYTCQPGHTYLHGNKTLNCDVSGSWAGVAITCQTLDCGMLSAPAHALVQETGTWYGQSANYSCLLGYAGVSGSTTRVCNASGQWSGTPLVCAAIDCGNPPKLAFTDVKVAGTKYNQTANYSCQAGYLYQQGQFSLVCGLSGKWTGTALKCAIINCGLPPKGNNLVLSYTSTTFGQRVTYSCLARYKYASGDRNLTCSLTGNWTGQLMTCVEKDCGVPDVYNSSDVRFTSTTFGSQAVYTCSLGSQRVSGDFTRTCQGDETWSGRPVTCSTSSDEKMPSSSHKTLDAPAAWAIGVAIFAVLATVTVLCIVLECGVFGKHSLCRRKPANPFRKGIADSLSSFRLTTKWEPGSDKEARMIPSSPSSFPSNSSSSLNMSFRAKDFHSGESLAKLNHLQPTHLTASGSQSQLFPPSVSPVTPRTSLSIPQSPSGITLSSLSERTLKNPMPDVGS